MGVEGKVICVTGASQGIGHACAKTLVAHGARVVITARTRHKLEAVAEEIGGDVLVHPADVSDEASVDALFAAIRERFGRLDVIFNNAGANNPNTDFGDTSWDGWRRVMAANIDGMFLTARGAYRMMRDQSPKGGRIINNGSISAHTPRPGMAPYTASKHAVTGLTKTIALDGRKHDIACSQIDIGNATTAMAAKQAHGVPQADGSIKPEPMIDTAVVSDTILYMAGLPLSANALFLTVMATKMPFVGRG